MEQRQDHVLRRLVDAVRQPLATSGFVLAERGRQDDFTWVEFEHELRLPDVPPKRQSVVLVHIGDAQHIGARYQEYQSWIAAHADRHGAQTWGYTPDAQHTTDGEPLATEVLA